MFSNEKKIDIIYRGDDPRYVSNQEVHGEGHQNMQTFETPFEVPRVNQVDYYNTSFNTSDTKTK